MAPAGCCPIVGLGRSIVSASLEPHPQTNGGDSGFQDILVQRDDALAVHLTFFVKIIETIAEGEHQLGPFVDDRPCRSQIKGRASALPPLRRALDCRVGYGCRRSCGARRRAAAIGGATPRLCGRGGDRRIRPAGILDRGGGGRDGGRGTVRGPTEARGRARLPEVRARPGRRAGPCGSRPRAR